jgi:protein SCO1/2
MLKALKAAPQVSLLVCALLCSGLAACRKPVEQRRYDLKGKVVSVDLQGHQVTVAHEDIADYMVSMTMPFTVKDEQVLKNLAPDDGLQATLVVEGGRSWLENIVSTRLVASAEAGAAAPASPEPKPGDEVPDFSLTNQDGKRISFHQYRGRAVALTFIYTRCPLPDYCPLMTERFAQADKALKGDPDLYARTRLLSITVDPVYDRPKILREYASAYTSENGKPSFDHWEFATGTEEEIKRVATYFGMQYFQKDDQIIHSLRTAVIAPDGKLVKLYTGSEWKPEEILADLQALK